MENVYFYTRMYGWEEPIIKYFKEKKLWGKVFLSKRFLEDEVFYKNTHIKQHVPDKLYAQLHAYFPQFIDMQTRMSELSAFDYREHNHHDYVNLFSLYCDVYYNFYTQEKIDLLVMNRAPHLGFDLVAVIMAEALGLKTLFLEQSHFPNRFFIYSKHADYGDFKTSKKVAPFSPIQIENKFEKELFYMQEKELRTWEKWKHFYVNNPFIRMLSQLTHKKYRGQAIYRYDLKKTFKANYRKYNKDIDLNEKFVYFGLHLQPEKTTSAWGGKYVDQLLALERLSEFTPEDVKIYVKENPKQTYMMRGKFFYERLKRIKKVILVPNDSNTYDLIKNSLFISTITGTMGWEAITGGKNVLVFGWGSWYKTLPGVFYFGDSPAYENLLNYKFTHSQLEDCVNQLLSKTGKGIIFPIDYYFHLVPDFDQKENTKNVASSIENFLYYS